MHHSRIFRIVGRSYRTKDLPEMQKNPAEPIGVHVSEDKDEG